MNEVPQFERYGLLWGPGRTDLEIEMYMVHKGGQWKKKNGTGMAGNGMHFHFRRMLELLWPSVVWHKWNELVVKEYLAHRTIVVIGAASTGKTHTAAICVLGDYFCFPNTTTVICCSTTKERLEDRVWGEIKTHFKMAKATHADLPGHLIESRQRIVTDEQFASVDGRDFRNGLMGVPCKKGNDFVGLAEFIGLKNKRVRLLGDEMSLLPKAFCEAVSNLDKNTDFKLIGLGNPKDTTDALGVMAEPAASVGGWEGGIDQTPGTKTWPTRRQDGICIQLPGSDSPNLDGRLGIPLITQEQIDRDVSFYGKDSLWFTMMNEGRMPRGQGSRRVITRQLCVKRHALEPPVWLNANRTRIGALDAAFRGVGGDRCVFLELDFGEEASALDGGQVLSAIISQVPGIPARRQIMALIDVLIVPINVNLVAIRTSEAEDQIVDFVMRQCQARGIPPQNFFFDAGMRSSLVSSFARLWSPQVVPIDFGGKPTERKVSNQIDVKCVDYYSKFVTELWYSVRLIIEAEQFRGMTEDVMSEFGMREWKMVGANKIEVETKEDMKKKTGRSPDLADAVAIACEGARRLGFQISNLSTVRRDRRAEQWKQDLRDQAEKLWKPALHYA
jgi:hypothetical protein